MQHVFQSKCLSLLSFLVAARRMAGCSQGAGLYPALPLSPWARPTRPLGLWDPHMQRPDAGREYLHLTGVIRGQREDMIHTSNPHPWLWGAGAHRECQLVGEKERDGRVDTATRTSGLLKTPQDLQAERGDLNTEHRNGTASCVLGRAAAGGGNMTVDVAKGFHGPLELLGRNMGPQRPTLKAGLS